MSPLVVTTAMTLEQWPDADLAALHLALTWEERAVVPPENRCFQRAVTAALIHTDGRPRDLESLLAAVEFVAGQRVANGTWGREEVAPRRDLAATIEALLDSHALSELLRVAAAVCSARADSADANHDAAAAQRWLVACDAIGAVASACDGIEVAP